MAHKTARDRVKQLLSVDQEIFTSDSSAVTRIENITTRFKMNDIFKPNEEFQLFGDDTTFPETGSMTNTYRTWDTDTYRFLL